MPFVNIVYNTQKEGLISNIDGKFDIKNTAKVEFLQFSYVGFKKKFIPKDSISQIADGIVYLQEKEYGIDEIVVHPGENPAHRIIKKAVKNRKLNNPDKLKSYSYTAYHKMIFTFEPIGAAKKWDSTKTKRKTHQTTANDSLMQTKRDTTKITAAELLARQHLFLMESVSEKKFRFPTQHHEELIASRVSGFKEPSFVLLANQLQSFSFYGDMISLADSRYINPLSPGSTKKYFFNIEDTTYTAKGDTVFSISFRPKKGKNFEALKGILNINTYKYAIQSVVAKPVEPNGVLGISIKQQYKLLEDSIWFPAELNTKLIFYNMDMRSMDSMYRFVGIGKSYLENIKINEEIKRKEIGKIDFDLDDKAFKQPDNIWQKYRYDTLSTKDKYTYHLLDSIGQKHHADLKLKFYKSLFKGYVPVSFINIDVARLLDFNVYEGFRPGIGLQTNEKLMQNIKLGGYIAYGFTDDRLKYGGKLSFILNAKQDLKASVYYKKDLMESGGYEFLEKPGLNATESYRYWFIQDMTYMETYAFSFQFRPFRKFKSLLRINQTDMNNTNGFYYAGIGAVAHGKHYRFFENSLQIAYTPKETLSYIDNELINSYGSAPAFYANISKGFENGFGAFDYWKVEAKLLLSALTKNFGRTDLTITSGKVFGQLPYFKLYNGHGSYYDFTVESSNSFNTMRMNEFLSDRFLNVFWRQDFGSLLFKPKKIRPKLVFVTSFGIGKLNNPETQQGISFKTMGKGYWESGLLINNIIKSANIIGIGFGVFYRYGAYAFDNTNDNFAYKLSMTFDL